MDTLKALFAETFGSEPLSVVLLPQSGSNRKYYRLSGTVSPGTSSSGSHSFGNPLPGSHLSGTASPGSHSFGNPLPGIHSFGNPPYVNHSEESVSCIGVVGTDDVENRTFCGLSDCFASVGIAVPRVIAHSAGYGRYLQEDLGSDDLNSLMKVDRESGEFTDSHRALLLAAVRSLPKIQFEGGGAWDFRKCYPTRRMNARKIMFDLNYFKYCFLKPMGIEFNEELLQDEFEKLCGDILSDPSENIFLYRDFQSRNVMVKDGVPYFIDFQSGMQGPFYYDIASFAYQFADRYPSDLREKMVDEYYSSLSDYYPMDRQAFRERLKLYVLLRHLQVLGCYGFRGLVEKKQIFIDCIPDGFRGIKEILSSGIKGYDYICECLRMLYDKRNRFDKPDSPAGESGSRGENDSSSEHKNNSVSERI